jgi:hypothetical protein
VFLGSSYHVYQYACVPKNRAAYSFPSLGIESGLVSLGKTSQNRKLTDRIPQKSDGDVVILQWDRGTIDRCAVMNAPCATARSRCDIARPDV